MPSILIFDEGASPERVLTYFRQVRGDMDDWIDLSTKLPLRSDVLVNPDLSALEGIVPRRWWKHEAGAVVEFTQAEKDALAAAEAAQEQANIDAVRTEAAQRFDEYDEVNLLFRAFANIVMDELNILRDLHSLAPRTLAQLKTAIKNKVTSGEVDT
jgi:hypothetical protein